MSDRPEPLILYADDDPASRDATGRVLRLAGFAVREATSGAEALRLVREQPDLVLLKAELPDVGGVEVGRRIRADPATAAIPVLHLSATSVSDRDHILGLDEGADGYLTQPVDPATLLSVVRALVRLSRAEARARHVARQWQATFDALGDGVALLDRTGRIERVNRALAGLLGEPAAALAGRNALETVPGLGGSVAGCPVTRLRQSRQRESLDIPLGPRGERWHRLTADPLLDAAGELAGAVLVVADITARRRTREALRESEERLRTLYENATIGLYRTTPDGRILLANPALVRMLGFDAFEELAARNLEREGYEPDYPRAHFRELVEQEGEVRGLEAAWRRRDGSTVYIRESARAVRGPDGAVLHYDGTVEDVTERRLAEETAGRYAQRLEVLREIDRAILAARQPAEAAQAALSRTRRLLGCQIADVLVLDLAAGEVEVLAQDAEPGFGFGAGTVLPLDALAPPATLAGAPVRYLEDAAALAERSPALEQALGWGVRSVLSVPLLAGGELLGEINFSAGRPAAFAAEHLAIAREVADELAVAIQQARLREGLARHAAELERRVAERTAELQRSNADLADFAYSVSHDLRAPLRAVRGFAEALLEDQADRLDAAGQDYARRIAQAAARMDTLAQDLLAYTRLSRAEVEVEPVSLDEVVAEALAQAQPELRARGAAVAVARPLPDALGQEAILVQAIVNLLTNAARFVAPGVQPRVRLRAELREERDAVGEVVRWVRLWVEDNGIGIAPEHHERIFRIFERLHTASQHPGTGVGLAIVRRGVERLGGRVGVESAAGEGSRFWLELRAVG